MNIKQLIKLYIVGAIVALMAFPATASAGPVRQCSDQADVNAYNITVRNTDCRTAHWFVVDFQRTQRTPRGYANARNMRKEFDRGRCSMRTGCSRDIRFTNGWQVIRFQSITDY